MTGPEHAQKALDLVEYSKREKWPLEHGGEYTPTEDERHRVLLEAHLHASLARTAALTDVETCYADGITRRARSTENEWHEFFNVDR
ncbi:MAG TPA: hypothetical protein VJ777_22910 [Mycobacterium sp.]|nr:hypothetical protein [Mycobacterium sp.]